MSNQPYKQVRNRNTGELYEATSSEDWLEKLTAWREAMVVADHDVRKCTLPSPMPLGHIMFLRSNKRRPYTYEPVEVECPDT